ncbi:hypothetical protein BBQ08_12685 [Listeria monocytogenes]|uniref:hypothetical protein n=1 Tax=Listeria monocytogenes TaxID=1639 RepID=UPI0010B8532B|nr:hypothetical protein [Listeria monocytogenes]EAC9872920.1 hypothetical protein [Listeria monocytogenes]EAE6569869.1 hypothetical protein [Listeria monocytogenes]EBF5192583.1 hypothetical protein [Listeria monocytogenes]EKF1562751.1 hypothetical protein [Listeria monocytogenes]
MARRWTEDDDIYLEYFIYESDTKLQEAADFLNRTMGAVYTRLTYLRNRNDNICYAQKNWSAKEKEFLKEHYAKSSLDYLARRLGRTKSSVAYQVSKLGLRKVKILQSYDEEIRKLASEGYYNRQASRLLGISNSSLIQYSRANGIVFRKATTDEMTEKWREVMKKEIAKSIAGRNRKRGTKWN